MRTRIAVHALVLALGVMTVHQEAFAGHWPAGTTRAPEAVSATPVTPAPRPGPVSRATAAAQASSVQARLTSQATSAPQGAAASQPAPATQPRTEPQPGPAPQAAAAPPHPAETRRRNVSVEVTISDQIGSEQPVKKIVTMIVADGLMGRVRSSGTVSVKVGEVTIQRPVILNVDATPILHGDGSLRLSVTLQYQPAADGDSANDSSVQLNESLTVTLESGKPLVVSRATDAAGRRKVAVEVTATVMK